MSSSDVGSYEFKRSPCEMQMEKCSGPLARSTSDGSADKNDINNNDSNNNNSDDRNSENDCNDNTKDNKKDNRQISADPSLVVRGRRTPLEITSSQLK